MTEFPRTLSSSGSRKMMLAVLPAMVIPFLGAYVYFVALAGTKLAMVLYTAVKFFTLLFPAFVVLCLERKRFSPCFDTRKHLRSLPAGIISGLLIALVILCTFSFTALGDLVLSRANTIRQGVVGLGVLPYYIPFVCFLSLAHSLLEEYYWRWFVYGRASRLWGRKLSVHLLAGLAFALHHYVVLNGFLGITMSLVFGTFVGLGGVIWSILFQRSNSLLGAWISHMLVDAAIMIIGYLILF